MGREGLGQELGGWHGWRLLEVDGYQEGKGRDEVPGGCIY